MPKMKHKLLIIDDDTDLTVLLAWHLSRDYDVIVASECLRGHEVSLFRKHRPHLILLELDLQGPSGVEILRDILHCDAKAVVIIVSSNPSLQLARDTIKMGARDYVSKPFNNEEIVLTMRHAQQARIAHWLDPPGSWASISWPGVFAQAITD